MKDRPERGPCQDALRDDVGLGALILTMERDDACDLWLAARSPLDPTGFGDLATDAWTRVAF